MKLITISCIYTITLFLSPALRGQTNAVYPDQSTAYFNNMYLINPASIPTDVKMNLSLLYKTKTGALSNITTFSFSFARILNYSKPNNHLIRIYFFNEKDGPYIQRPRASLNYAYKLAISDKLSLSSGVSLGFVQTIFTAPSATGNGNATSPDAAIGIAFLHKKFDVGFSINQILNASVNPVAAQIQYTRYYNTYLNYTFKLSHTLKLKSGMLWNYLPTYPDNINLYGMLEIKEIFSFGSCYRYNKNLSFIVSTNFFIMRESILLSFIYNTPLSTTLPNWTDSIELNGGYSFH
jgi:type IX secretion system PorP/SprF family membrane protein